MQLRTRQRLRATATHSPLVETNAKAEWKESGAPNGPGGDQIKAQRALSDRAALFSFLYLKKQNFKNICRIGKFSKMGACRPLNGRQDLNIKKLHLGPGAQGALNSELIKLI